jgi:DHA1 family bicyclomycin/chloramphenicol resistance-like MFS transporter
MKETVERDLSRLNLRALGRSYRMLLGNRQFLTAAGVIGGALGAIYAQATFLPFILIDKVGLTPQQFGLAMLAQSGSFFTASLIMRALMNRFSAKRLVPIGLALIALGSLGTMSLLIWPPSFLHVMIPVAIYAFGIAFVMPDMSTVALAPFRREAGAAAAMLGFIQMGSGLFVGTLGALLGNAVLAMGLLIPAMGATACFAYFLHRRTNVIMHDRSTPPPGGAGPMGPRTAPVTGPDR